MLVRARNVAPTAAGGRTAAEDVTGEVDTGSIAATAMTAGGGAGTTCGVT